ncbi:MAG: carboxypeptidase regulatory-like domain-containing protein [Acidobacteria bacterium]|nr:carboxypeptidase regulatory-like domain-containing protein [Acidobacteriota bacterium]
MKDIIADVPFRLEFSRGPAVTGRYGPYTIAAGDVRNLELQEGALSEIGGTVEATAGFPIGGAEVTLTRVGSDPRYVSSRPSTIRVTTDSFGRFSFSPLLPGDFQGQARKEGFPTRRFRLSSGGTPKVDLPIRLSQ